MEKKYFGCMSQETWWFNRHLVTISLSFEPLLFLYILRTPLAAILHSHFLILLSNSLQKGAKNCTSLCNSIVCPELPLIKYSLLRRTDNHVGKMTALISSLLLRCICGLAGRAYKRMWIKRWKCFKLECSLETEQVPWIHHYLPIYAIPNKKSVNVLFIS